MRGCLSKDGRVGLAVDLVFELSADLREGAQIAFQPISSP